MKKLFALLLCFSMLLSSAAIGIGAFDIKAEDSYTVGDVDGSGIVNSGDSLCLKATIAGKRGYTCDVKAADFDANGTLGSSDSYLLKSCIAGRNNFSDYENGRNIYRLTIGGYDIKEFCIVVPEDATSEDNAHFAAERMRQYIEIATGAELEICYGNENRTKPHAIVYNMVPLDSELGLELGYEGYKYDVTDGDLNIYGTARGNMYCTFTILENIGFVFYSNDYVYLYENRLCQIDEGDGETFVPHLTFRMVTGTFGGSGSENHFFPRKLNGSQLYQQEDSTRTGTLTGPRFINAHSFGYYWRMATGTYTDDDHLYECWLSGEQKEESDWGKEDPWQPCAREGSDDYKKLMLGLDRTITMLEKRGQKFPANISAMSFSIADNQRGYCSCRACYKKSLTEGYSGVYIDLTNYAAREIRELYPEYPTLRLMSIIYDHTIPQTVRPESNVIIFFCGQGCNNHVIDSGGCTGHSPLVHKLHNDEVVKSLKAWTEYCHESGAQIWFWYYPVSFLFYMSPCPNVLKLYDDFDFIINDCNVDGMYFECGGRNYGFEPLKAHMASLYMYDPEMTREEYTEHLKEYLYIYYGEGYEYIYEYLLMHDRSGNVENCYLNNFSYPQEMYDEEYLAENYEYMRGLILNALAMTDKEDEIEHLELLLATCDFTGLSAVHSDWYKNGSNAEGYMANYDNLCRLIQKYGMRPSTFGTDEHPEQLDFTDYENSPWDQVA